MNLKYLLQICLRIFKENKSVGKWNQITILDEDDNVHISFVNNVATLQIRSVDNGHSGRYTCQAKNESGVERCYAFLLVQGV